MVKQVVFLPLFFSLLSFTMAQQTNSPSPYGAMANAANTTDEINRLTDSKHYKAVSGFDNRYQGIKGSPFLEDEWMPGVLHLKDSSLIRRAFVYKFDAYGNEIWAKDSTGLVRVLQNAQLRALDLSQPDGTICMLRKYGIPELGGAHRLFRALYEGEKYTLAMDAKKTLKKSNLEDRGLVTVGNAYDWFEDQSTCWLKIQNRPFVEISLKKSKFIDHLPAEASQKAADFCKKSGIKAKLSPVEAAALLQFLEKG